MRAARSLVCGVVTVALASAAHVAGGGLAPRWSSAVLLVAVVALASSLVLASPSSRRRIVAFVLLGQLAMHLALSALSTPMTRPTGATGSAMSGMVHATGPGSLDRVPDGWYAMVLHHAVDGLGTVGGVLMLAGHVAAALLAGLWLAGGERLLWSLLALAAAPLAAARLRLQVLLVEAVHALDPDRLASSAALVRCDVRSWRPTSRYDVNTTARRGPPRSALRVLA